MTHYMTCFIWSIKSFIYLFLIVFGGSFMNVDLKICSRKFKTVIQAIFTYYFTKRSIKDIGEDSKYTKKVL